MRAIVFILLMSGLGFWSQAAPVKKPHFYQITKGSETHYLLGTFHYAVKWSDFPAVIHRSFDKARVWIGEVEFRDGYRDILWTRLDQTKTPPLPNLKKGHIEKLRKLGVSDKLLPRSDDDDAELFLFFPLQGNHQYYSMDADIFFKAKDARKKLLTLDEKEVLSESKKFGPSHTTSLKIGDVLDMMSETEIRNWAKSSLDQYLAGPAAGLADTDRDGGIEYRNKKWLPKLLRFYKDNNFSFTAVGSAHLYGKTGLIQLLKDNGYKVELKTP